MRDKLSIQAGFRLVYGTAAIALLLTMAALPAVSGPEGTRSYYFSRTAQPYDSYESWLKANPRYMHPYHDTIHGPLFSNANSSDPKMEEMKTKPYPDQPAFKTRLGGPWGSGRILWVNDRYYSGKYYPTAEKKE